MSQIFDIVKQTRAVRRFVESKRVKSEQLRQMIEVARITASARNSQPLKYVTVTDESLCEQIFDATGWASAISDGRPIVGERPTGYIVIYNDKSLAVNSMWDQGIVSYTMMMAATEMGLGGCIIATIFRDKMPALDVSDDLEPVIVLAIGYPCEDIRLVDVVNGSVKYYRDSENIHYVPKRSMNEILIGEF